MSKYIHVGSARVTVTGKVDCSPLQRDCILLPGRYAIQDWDGEEFINATIQDKGTGWIMEEFFFMSDITALQNGSN